LKRSRRKKIGGLLDDFEDDEPRKTKKEKKRLGTWVIAISFKIFYISDLFILFFHSARNNLTMKIKDVIIIK
jgi:hypothetical protein